MCQFFHFLEDSSLYKLSGLITTQDMYQTSLLSYIHEWYITRYQSHIVSYPGNLGRNYCHFVDPWLGKWFSYLLKIQSKNSLRIAWGRFKSEKKQKTNEEMPHFCIFCKAPMVQSILFLLIICLFNKIISIGFGH